MKDKVAKQMFGKEFDDLLPRQQGHVLVAIGKRIQKEGETIIARHSQKVRR